MNFEEKIETEDLLFICVLWSLLPIDTAREVKGEADAKS